MSQEPPKIHVSWGEYLALQTKLFEAIADSSFKPEQVVCIARGGLIPGNLASVFFGVPLAVMAVASYPDHATKQEEVHFSRDLATARPLKRSGILVMDDLTETGVTLIETLKWLCHWYSIDPEAVRTAVIWHKAWSKFVPDFYAEEIQEGPNGERPWIVQPAEGFRRGKHRVSAQAVHRPTLVLFTIPGRPRHPTMTRLPPSTNSSIDDRVFERGYHA